MTREIAHATAIPDKIRYAKALANSGLLPKEYSRQPANVLYAIEYAEMLNLPAMSALTGIHVIDEKPTASAGQISELVRRAGHRLRVTGNDEKATGRSADPTTPSPCSTTCPDSPRDQGLPRLPAHQVGTASDPQRCRRRALRGVAP